MYSLWGKIRSGVNKGEWTACWYFKELQTAESFARYRLTDVPDQIIMIKDENNKFVAWIKHD